MEATQHFDGNVQGLVHFCLHVLFPHDHFPLFIFSYVYLDLVLSYYIIYKKRQYLEQVRYK